MNEILQGKTLRRRTWLLAMMFAVNLTAAARAEVRIEGSPTALRVTAEGAALSDVLSAFGGNFNVKYRTAIPLDAATSGTYAGSFAQVVSRLLDGYNFVIKKDLETTEIVVFGLRGQMAIPPPAPKAPPAGLLSRWR
jgi:hypothetical protein